MCPGKWVHIKGATILSGAGEFDLTIQDIKNKPNRSHFSLL